MAGRNLQLALSLLAIAVFAIVPKAAAQDLPLREAPANLSQAQIDEFNRINTQGQALLRHLEYAKARAAFEQACKIDPTAFDVQCNLGLACMRMGDEEEALRHFQQALTIEPDNADALFNVGNCYLQQGKVKEARLFIQKSIDSKSASPALIADAKAELATCTDAHLGIVGDQLAEGAKNSDDYLDSIVKANGTCRWSITKIPLKVFFEPGTAVQYYRPEFRSILVSAFNEWTAATKGNLSWIEVPNKDNADIVCKWQRVPEKVLIEGGDVLPDIYDVASGAHIFKHATLTIYTMRPNPVEHGLLLPIDDTLARALCLHEAGHALGLRGHSPNRNDAMGCGGGSGSVPTCLSTRDMNTIARLYTLTATDKAGDLIDNGVALINQGRFEEARSMLEKACTLDPNDYSSPIHDALGMVCERLDDLPSAVKHFRLAIQFEPLNSQLLLALGHCYYRQGNKKETVECLEKFIAKEPNDPHVAAARKLVTLLSGSSPNDVPPLASKKVQH